MTPEELDEAIVEEAKRRINKNYEIGIGALPGDVARVAARLAREGWTPPEPEPVVDPDLLAYREWASHERHPAHAIFIKAGDVDEYITCDAYLAGARMAREQERERANHPIAFAVRVMAGVFKDLGHAEREARTALAKYRGEA